MNKRTVSLTKLTTPRLPKVVERARLFKRLDDARKIRPIIWITAPPGFGKTTLVASYLRARKLPNLWYQVDEGDADPATLFHYLQLAAQKSAPRYRRPLPHLTPEFLPGIHIFARRFFEQLYARLKSPSVLVFDNFQDTPSDASVQELLRIGLDVIPAGVSVICISREDPPSAFARLQVGQTIEQVGEESLRLTREEAKDLIQLHAKGAKRFLTNDILDELLERTQGWTAALILLLEEMKTKHDANPCPDNNLHAYSLIT